MSFPNSRSPHRIAIALALALGLALVGCRLPDRSQTPVIRTRADLDQLPREARMPLTPDVRYQRLPNGLRYFILPNREPQGRAELRFVVNAGSLVEEDDQQGFAHFMEHMLFNGTERFPGLGVIAFLQATGMQVGPDANAYTTQDETVCVIKVPTDNPRILPIAFDVMQDWATAVTLDPAEVDAERGVILEERRERTLSAAGRISRKLSDAYLTGSRYADRLPIGTADVIQNGPRDRLESFYRTWYRPENLSIVAVGDFDPAAVEALILERFMPIPASRTPEPARPSVSLPDAGTTYAVIRDREQPVTSVSVTWRRPGVTYPTVGSYQNYLVAQLFDRMLNTRLLELVEKENSPVLEAGAQRGLYVRAMQLRTVTALAPEGKAQEALAAILTEVERVRRHGFGAAELEREKQNVLAFYDRAAAEDQDTPSSSLADELVRHVTTDEPVLGILAERAITARFMPTITLADLNAEAAQFDVSNRVVTVISPEKEGLVVPDETALASVVARVESSEIADYDDRVATGELMAQTPEPAAITSRRELPEIGVTELVLANGARVIYKPTRFQQQEVLFRATSPGGASLVSDADYTEARLAGTIVSESGVADFSRGDLLKILAGKDLAVVPSIDSYLEGMDGQARTADLPSLLQLIHLYFTAPRQDRGVATRIPRELISRIENLKLVPEAALDDATTEALYGKTVRAGRLQVDDLSRFDPERMFAIYRERFANAGDFTFSFVGSFEPAELEMLVQRYLGTLPAKPQREQYRALLPKPPQKVVTRTLKRGSEQRSTVRMVFEGALARPVTPETLVQASLIEQEVGGNLQSEMREARGAVYGVQVDVAIAEIPEPTYRATVEFTTDPRNVDELVSVVLAEIDDMRAKAPSERSLAISKEAERRKREEAEGSNIFWLAVLDHWGRFPDSDPRSTLQFEAQLEAVTPEQVQAFEQEIFRKDRYVKIVLQPMEVGQKPAGAAKPLTSKE